MYKLTCFYFCLFLTCSFGFIYEYLNVNSQHGSIYSSSEAPGYEKKNSYDGNSEKSFRTLSSPNSLDNLFYKIYKLMNNEGELQKIRILKMRDGHETMLISIKSNLPTINTVSTIEIDYLKGWNEIDFPKNKTVKEIKFQISKSNYTTLEIAELQVFFIYKLYHSCLEWYDNQGVNLQKVLAYKTNESYIDNVAKIEAGSSCFSSSGRCQNAIKDSVVFIDDIWQPSNDDKTPFLHVNFFMKYTIFRLKVKYPRENTIDKLFVKNDEEMIEMTLNKMSNLTEMSCDIQTKWLRFQIYLNAKGIFKGLYEVEAYSERIKVEEILCAVEGKVINMFENWNKIFIMQECDNFQTIQ